MHKKHPISPYVLFASLSAALGAFLFGYQTGIISGALLFISEEFQLTIFEQEILVSIVLIGCVIGSISGSISDFLGRKRTLFLTALLFLVSTLCMCIAESFSFLLVGRLIVGFAIGLASVTVPLYIAEISPPESRGALVSLNQLMITIGILISFWMAYLFAGQGEWRTMFAIAFIPAVLQFVLLFFIPETPGWLISNGKTQEAEKILHRLRFASPKERLAPEVQRIDPPVRKGFAALLDPAVRMPFLIGVGISVFQQITGINTVIYYAPRIFQIAGFASAESAIYATIWVGVVNVVMTVVGLWLVDRVGRRALALTGLAGMAASLAVLGYSFFSHSPEVGPVAIISLLAYIAFFAPGLGIVAWLIISEIYPLGIRASAMSVATFANWAANYVITLTFLTLIQLLTIGGTYWIFSAICVLGFGFVWKLVPETKGKTFEEIQRFWHK